MDPSRRDLLRQFCYGLAAAPLLSACDRPAHVDTIVDGPDSTGDGSGSADAISGSDWASGGTQSMTDKATYPDPFTGSLSSCLLVASMTQGPCTTATDLAREDVSEGWTGLPVRLGVKVVDSNCNPLAGAQVKIWHTNIVGSYSGQTPNNAFCLTQQSYATMDFMRGVQTTSSAGIVYFDTCFPGWYAGRAIHIHFQILQGTTSTRVSQLFFPADITQQIFAKHPEYAPYGQPDTSNASDGVFSGVPAAQRDRVMVDVARMTDGAMLASKVVTVV
jgi:protocatechuate 3,4-dioxygenase beta subunit